MTEWLTPAQVAALAGRHVVTVWRALESGELHGHQATRKGRWRIDPASVDAWVRGRDSREPCCGRVAQFRPRQRSA